jgi:hypothetical protein
VILRGWKDICTELGGISLNAARRLAQTEGLPIAIIAGKPTTTKDALKAWVEKRCQALNATTGAHQPTTRVHLPKIG